MNKGNYLLIIIPPIFICMAIMLGCSQSPLEEKAARRGSTQFQNPAYGFSFNYPGSWKVRSDELPLKMAILDQKQNAILILASPIKEGANLTETGMLRLEEDSGIKAENAEKTLILENIGENRWYQYTLEANEQKLTSVIAGTFCNAIEVRIILVSQTADIQGNRVLHNSILASFRC